VLHSSPQRSEALKEMRIFADRSITLRDPLLLMRNVTRVTIGAESLFAIRFAKGPLGAAPG
jgi:hypothetical protein